MINNFFLYFALFSFNTFWVGCAEGRAVATGHPLATKAGLEVLEEGGNAFDAAVAISATLSVVEPAMSGLGGYGSTLIYHAETKEIRYLNSSGKFPSNANSDLLRAPTTDYKKNREGPKSISTPGNLNAWKEMHEKYGKLAWRELFEQAIYYAEEGFPVAPYMAQIIAFSFEQFSSYSQSFYGKEGKPLREGEWLIQKDLAKTYKLIADQGPAPFYHGEIAHCIDRQMKELGSFLTLDDLQADVAEWWDPLKISYKGYDIFTIGTPGNGFSTLFTLGLLESFDHSQNHLHILIEALKESSKIRRITSGKIEERDRIVNEILTPQYFLAISHGIDRTKASPFEVHEAKEGTNTTHFVVIDQWGNIVSSTQTLGLGFGCKVMIEGTGIWMNSSMAFCTFEPKGNPMDMFPENYKISGNSPIIILKEGEPWAALGTPGGHTIPQNVAQIIINLIDFKMTMQEAIDAPKLAFIEESNVVCAEQGFEPTVLASLASMGHSVDHSHNHVAGYIGLGGKMGNAMGVKIIPTKEGLLFDIGIDKRKDAWTPIAPNPSHCP